MELLEYVSIRRARMRLLAGILVFAGWMVDSERLESQSISTPTAAASGPATDQRLGVARDTTSDAWLTVERIFGEKEFQPEEVGPMVWSRRTPSYFTLRRSEASDEKVRGVRELWRTDIVSGESEAMLSSNDLTAVGATKPLSIDSFEFSKDESKLLIFTNSKKVWRRNTRGDYWVLDLETRTLKKIGGDTAPSTTMFAKFSPDGSRIGYVHENNLYVQELSNSRILPMTSDGSSTLINGTSDWVNEEELGIRDGYRWSPDSQSIAFWQFDTSGVKEFKMIDNTHGNYPRIHSFPYPKVGEKNSATRLGLASVAGGNISWFDIAGDPRENYLPQMEWSPNGTAIQIQQMNRLQNSNRVLTADPQTAATKTLMVENDSAWIENENPVRWAGKGESFLWLSERDGWRHLYSISSDGQRCQQLTTGEWDVIQVEAVDEANGWVYLSASPENATQRYLYRVSMVGGPIERLSPIEQSGWHTYEISPDTQYAFHTYSTFADPPLTELISLPAHRTIRVLTDNKKLRAKLEGLHKPTAEFRRVELADGTALDAWCLQPPGFDADQKYPLLFHVYGEPHGQTVKDTWPGQRGLWHWMLAQQGYLVVSVDNRGTFSPRGREWRKVVHRQIGILASQEQAAAADVLIKEWPFVDKKRIGIWGWSGGGSMSLNMIFRYPHIYRTAIAVAPVAKQELYDSIYQERYMGLPTDNASGFRDGSPLTHAHQLQGNLLLVHGTSDDNVHYQATEMLINELISQNKYFSVIPYPGRSHSIAEGDRTVSHFYQSLTQYLHQHLKEPHDAMIRRQNQQKVNRSQAKAVNDSNE